MKFKSPSLRLRIFISMILLVLLASILIAMVAIYQYREEAKDYHEERLLRKEIAITRSINFELRATSFPVQTDKIPFIFKDKIYEVADIHNLQINIYDLEGNLLKTSKANIAADTIPKCLEAYVLNNLSNSVNKRFVEKRTENDKNYQSSFTYVNDGKFKPIAILNLPYLEDDDFFSGELIEFLKRLGSAYFFMFLIAIGLAYLLSKYITQPLKTISDKITATRLEKRNEKIEIESNSEEINTLVKSYNDMIDLLEDSAVVLAQSEREQAWREMAKQVAHEIKNPLTPMRLSVQSFQHKFDPSDPDIIEKVTEYSNTLIQQIDTMNSIAGAFSNFAKMPAQQNETLNVVKIVKLALDIFNEHYIEFNSEEKEIIAKLDRTQLIRVVTNLVKNGIQAIPEGKIPKIVVGVASEGHNVVITVADNGIGVSEENKLKVFEPKFTTKTSGMGLGLAMVKNIVETYKGSITFTTEPNEGTIFKVTFPKSE